MKKIFLTLAVLVMALCANAQTNQMFWFNGQLMFGAAVAQTDSLVFSDDASALDTLHLLLPRTATIVRRDTIYVHDTVYVNNCGNTDAKGDGVLPGTFNVGENTQVHFSQGNLQYQASTQTWRFAENQYDVIGSDNANISASYSGWIDLFGWGTGNNPTNSSTNESDYSTFVDWGVNAISNGGNKANMWRTLTKDEWDYLLHKRAGYNTSYSHATVNTVQGHILLPDNFVIPSDIHFEPVAINFTTNVYDFDQWQKMEKAGAVFLPAGGRRSGTSYIPYYFDNANKKMLIGTYWSSTLCPAGWYGHPEGAYYIFYSSYGYAINDGYRSNGFSVRLVQDAN